MNACIIIDLFNAIKSLSLFVHADGIFQVDIFREIYFHPISISPVEQIFRVNEGAGIIAKHNFDSLLIQIKPITSYNK